MLLFVAMPVSSLLVVPWGAGGSGCLGVSTEVSALHMTVLCILTRREINTFGLVVLPSV